MLNRKIDSADNRPYRSVTQKPSETLTRLPGARIMATVSFTCRDHVRSSTCPSVRSVLQSFFSSRLFQRLMVALDTTSAPWAGGSTIKKRQIKMMKKGTQKLTAILTVTTTRCACQEVYFKHTQKSWTNKRILIHLEDSLPGIC